MTGILVGPSKSGKSTALVSMILEQYRGCFERVITFSPSINVDDSWRPVKKYIEEVMRVNTDREQVYFEDWDEAALRRIINQQRKITETSEQLKMKQLYQILLVIDDFADLPSLHKKTGDSALDTCLSAEGTSRSPPSSHSEAPPDQQRGQGQFPVLHGLAPAKPAGEGQPAGEAHGAAAEARSGGHLREGRQGALQLPVHLPAEPQGCHVP